MSTPLTSEHRTKLVRERCRSSAALARRLPLHPSSPTTSSSTSTSSSNEHQPLFTILCHKGLEVILTFLPSSSELAVIHARTRAIFQRIPLHNHIFIEGEENEGGCLALTSNCNGQVFLMTSCGRLICFTPYKVDPKVVAFGSYHWRIGHIADVRDIGWTIMPTKNNETGKCRNKIILLSPSKDKLLLVHHSQMAVYDISSSEFIWHIDLCAEIEHASLSGDGAGIVVALKGEGVGVPFPFGVRTFVLEGRSTGEEGEETSRGMKTQENKSMTGGHVRKKSGMMDIGPVENPPMPKSENFDGLMTRVFGDEEETNTTAMNANTKKHKVTYHPGPFLVHSSPVSRLSFRGKGTNTSSSAHNKNNNHQTTNAYESVEEGNDLLLTTCSDGTVRIFSQNSWRQLMQWQSPLESRADWVRGISAANLGDLDTNPGSSTTSGNHHRKKSKNGGAGGQQLSPIPKDVSNSSHNNSSSAYYGHPSSDASNSNNNSLHQPEKLHQTPNSSAIPTHSEPGTHAGAWIAELTFRNTFPALRLSRLSYMKSGGEDALPAHFESVAAILPGGSLDETLLLQKNDGPLVIEGIWPLWDAWEAEGKGAGGNIKWVSPGNNAAPSNPGEGGAPRWLGDGADLGGSHAPPSELRITSCHLRGDCVNQIEMSIWGDKDFGAMEFGSPIQHVMMLPGFPADSRLAELPTANLEFEAGSRLCARTSLDRRSIDLWWRKHGSVHLEEDFETPTIGPKIFRDISLTPLPLCLPSITLPGKPPKQSDSSILQDKQCISSLHWWPDENFGGPPRLVTLTRGGSIIVFEMPPPWSALEPPMPNYDPFDDDASRGSSVESGFGANNESFEVIGVESFDGETQLQYEVSITPHPDFGIGLRLEAQAQGMPATAGSFKKHPLSGGRLPAEREGVISLGDELLAVNDISLEGMPFEKAIATVRQIGFDSFGAPLRMKFRRCKGKRSRGSAGPSLSSGSRSSRRQKVSKDNESQATLEVGADAENQQEFGRIIAIVRDVVVGAYDQTSPPAMLLIPWNFGKGAVVSHKMYGGALLLWAVPGQRTIKAARLEVVLDIDPENSRFVEIGSIQLNDQGKFSDKNQSTIKSISFVSSTERGWLVAILDSIGNTSLLFIETSSSDSPPSLPSSPSNIKAKFRHYPSVFNLHEFGPVNQKSDPKETCIFRSFSLELFGCMGSSHACKELAIWTALPETKHQTDTSLGESPYKCYKINIEDVKEISNNEVIVDFRWLSSGFMDAFPWLVLFTQNAAVLYRRPCHELSWQPITVLFYQSYVTTEMISPHDAFPHLTSGLKCVIHTNDEQSIRSDWHPESILANICTEGGGVHLALQSHTYALYSWLSQWMNEDESRIPQWDAKGSTASVPFTLVNDKTIRMPDTSTEQHDSVETSANLMAAMSLNSTNSTKPRSKEELALIDLLNSLCPFEESQKLDNLQSKDFKQSMPHEKAKKKPMPTPLQDLSKQEKMCVWVIGDIICNMPSFKGLDSLSQLCLFSVTLMRKLVDAAEKSHNPNSAKPVMLTYVDGRPEFRTQSSNVHIEQTEVQHTAASSAFLSALMSDTQSQLIQACRPKDEKFNWETARAVGIPFWVRSEKSLVSIAEEIAQTVYKSSKSVMDCALYYVAMRNMKKLRAIAATDRSDSGKKFLTFITDHDFSSDRGRNAAEKNAYSLLRKRKYASAASFFLLAEPPMIKTALNIIKSQMHDVSLAFFVARLMQYASKSSTGSSNSLTIGGGFNLSSMGGGGGFAGSGSFVNDSNVTEENSIPFRQWEPCLDIHSSSVLKPDIQDTIGGDNCFDSLQLLWLNRPNDAMLRLAHMPAGRSESISASDCTTPFITACEREASLKPGAAPFDSMVMRTNAVINFCSSPSLLKVLKPKKRILWSSSLIISRALNRCGIDIPSMRVALEVANSSYDDDDSGRNQQTTNGQRSSNTKAQSIFDSFETATPRQETKQQTPADPMSSSIFDSFDAAPSKPQPVAQAATDPMSSSIFDSFDAAPPKPKPKPQLATADPMSSSIFDSFDAAPPKPKPKPQPVTADPMSSSIFDSFNTPASKKAVPPSTYQEFSTDIKNTTSSNHLDVKKEEPLEILSFSRLWDEWKDHLVRIYAASRLLRELARITSSFHCEPYYCSIESLTHHGQSPISSGTYEVLHKSCDSDGLTATVNNILRELTSAFHISEEAIIEKALELTSADTQPRRLACSVLLQCLLGRIDRAEDAVRDASVRLISDCESLGLSNDSVTNASNVNSFVSSQWARRDFGNLIFQLEICMWFHRGGIFDISSIAAKEALLAVRVGLAAVNWGRCYQTLDTLIKAEPDCPVDFDVGRNLWRSMKIISNHESALDCVEGVTSGGWEFLVDCRREEATEMLRNGLPGQFLIRPHPQDPGVFTISFKTNLIPTDTTPATNYDDAGGVDTEHTQNETPSPSKVIKRDDVVQHAIIRLTDTGFRCGSFGPFATLTKLLQAVSGSLPFDLRFNDPPVKGIIKERGVQSSPNSFLFKKLSLHSTAEFIHVGSKKIEVNELDGCSPDGGLRAPTHDASKEDAAEVDSMMKNTFGLFGQLLFLSEFRKQLCAVAATQIDEPTPLLSEIRLRDDDLLNDDYDGSISEGSLEVDEEENLANASRMVRPLLNWCRAKEIKIVEEIAPLISDIQPFLSESPLGVSINASGNEFEVPTAGSISTSTGCTTTQGDTMIRNCIQPGSGVDFRTLRVGEPGNSVIVVLFGKDDAIQWLATHETGGDENEAQERLKMMELKRVIEPITWSDLSLPKGYAASHPSASLRYRFVDPWEVEPLDSKAGETASVALGRERYQTLTIGLIASACEHVIRSAGGLHLLGLWSTLRGGIYLTKALCSIHPSWERDAGGDLLMKGGFLMEPSPYENSIRQHLYANSLFRSLKLPQRFLALVQVDLLDLKNVTTPSGSSSVTAYAMLRLKRKGGSAPLNHKARSLDSAITQARKISKISGPNAPASWGSIVRFRFPLPEDVDCEGKSVDADRESLFKGPPTCLQVTVYEKKFMSDVELGGADISLDSLGTGGQIEEWVPLRVGKDGITWFARMRISLRFDLLCLDSPGAVEEGQPERCPSFGLTKIRSLSRLGAHEDHNMKSSISTPQLMGYFNMLY